MSSFPQQQNESCEEIIKYGPFTGKKKLIENFPEEAQTLDLIDKDFNQQFLCTKKTRTSHQVENISKETRIIKRDQIETLEFKRN